MRTLPRLGAGLLVLTLAGGIAACGDDDETSPATTAAPEAEGDTAAYCEAVVEFNSAVFAVDIAEDSTAAQITEAGAGLAPLSEALVEHAPEALADEAAAVDAVVQPLTEGDATAFQSDDTFETYTGFLDASIDECDFEEIAVTGVDYAFEGVPETMDAGVVSFAFENESDAEEHEMVILRKKDGVNLSWAELFELEEDEAEEMTEFVSAAFAPPGEGGSTLAELTPGAYVMSCFIGVGGAEDGPPHSSKGMLHEFTVE